MEGNSFPLELVLLAGNLAPELLQLLVAVPRQVLEHDLEAHILGLDGSCVFPLR